jgi:subtilisin family serine protease
MSLGGSLSSSSLDQAVRNAISSGIVVVAAAGNDNSDACNYTPGSTPGVINVGASDFLSISNKLDIRYPFTNFGPCVSIFAPGAEILSASISSDFIYRFESGTSMAAPFVSGVASLYLAKYPQATPAEVKEAIVNQFSTLNAISDAGPGSPNKLLYSFFDSLNRDLNPPTAAPTKSPSQLQQLQLQQLQPQRLQLQQLQSQRPQLQ